MSWFADSELAAISYLAGPGAGLLVNDVYSYGENITYIHTYIHTYIYACMHTIMVITFAGQKKSL